MLSFLYCSQVNKAEKMSVFYSKFAFYLKQMFACTTQRNGSIPELLLKTFATKLFSYLKTLLLQEKMDWFPGGVTAKCTGSKEK